MATQSHPQPCLTTVPNTSNPIHPTQFTCKSDIQDITNSPSIPFKTTPLAIDSRFGVAHARSSQTSPTHHNRRAHARLLQRRPMMPTAITVELPSRRSRSCPLLPVNLLAATTTKTSPGRRPCRAAVQSTPALPDPQAAVDVPRRHARSSLPVRVPRWLSP